jgi:hypothetical protein
MAEHGKSSNVAFVGYGGASRRIELRQAAADHASSALLVDGNTRRDVREPICRFLALENFFWHRRLMTGKAVADPCRKSLPRFRACRITKARWRAGVDPRIPRDEVEVLSLPGSLSTRDTARTGVSVVDIAGRRQENAS